MIELKDFSFQYKAQSEPTLKNLNFTIYKGEKVLIVGPSGSGKSTIGQCLNGIIPNIYKGTSSGQFLIQGKEAFDLSIYEKSHLVSTVLQDTDGQFIGLSVAEDLAFAFENDMVELGTMKERVQSWAERLDLMKLLDHRPQDLSGGQKQRIAIVRSLCMNPEIILFDEVTAALDPEMVREVLDVILGLAKDGMTMLIVTHEMNFARQVANRIVFMDKGQIIEQAKPEDFFTNPTTDRAKTFLNILNYEPRGTNYEENI